MYDAVLLDLYDTLVWSEWGKWQRTLADALEVDIVGVGRAFDETRPARSTGLYADADGDLGSVVEALGLTVTPGLIAELRELEQHEIEQDIHLYEDSLPVVRELRRRGIRTVLVSNCSHNTRPVVERFGLTDELDALILSFEVATMKPQPEIYLEALERAGGAAPERAVFVDDQLIYCDGAAAVGIDTRLILRPSEPAEGLVLAPDRHATITDLSALLQL